MILKLENIGKVRKAEINLDNITVIAGENNTGKSTVSKALFAVGNSFDGVNNVIENARVDSVSKEINKVFRRVYHFFINAESAKKIARHMVLNLDKILKKEQIQEVFAGILHELPDYSKKIEIDQDAEEIAIDNIYKILKLSDNDVLERIVKNSLLAEFDRTICCVLNENSGRIVLQEEVYSAEIYIENSHNLEEVDGIHIRKADLKTERGIYIDNSVDNLNEGNRIVSQTFRWGHKQVLESDLNTNNSNVIDDLLNEESINTVLNKVNVIANGSLKKTDNYNWIYRLGKEEKGIPIRDVSSGVQVFAVLKRLLYNGVLRNAGFLILDEPETHLHPAWQVVFAEIIVLLHLEVGIKILMNTHSPYFLNAMEVFSAKYKLADKINYYFAYDDDGMAEFEDVTGNTEKIYKKLLEPMQILEDLKAEYD